MNNGFDTHTTSEHLLSAVIEQLALAGHRVHVIQLCQNGERPVLPQRLAELGVTTDSIANPAPRKTNFVARYLGALRYYCNCRRAVKAHRDAEAVFLQSTNVVGYAVWLARRLVPYAAITLNVQDVVPYNAAFSGMIKKNSLVFKVLAAVQRYGYRHADHVITISEDMKDTLVRDGVDADKIEVIYNWSYQDEPYDSLDLAPVAHMFRDDCFRVVYAGNIGVMQNVEIMVETARLMMDNQNIRFYIIGDGVRKRQLEAKAEDYGLTNLFFYPMQPPELAPLIYSAADVNVIPLAKDIFRTALPSKTATCLACGKPIIFAIGKDSKFGQRLLKETGCLLTEPDCPEELADGIRRIQNGSAVAYTGTIFQKCCRRSVCSRNYVRVITG